MGDVLQWIFFVLLIAFDSAANEQSIEIQCFFHFFFNLPLSLSSDAQYMLNRLHAALLNCEQFCYSTFTGKTFRCIFSLTVQPHWSKSFKSFKTKIKSLIQSVKKIKKRENGCKSLTIDGYIATCTFKQIHIGETSIAAG